MIWITSDSAWDIPKEWYKDFGFDSISTPVNLDGKEYYDGISLTPDGIYEFYDKTGCLPKTAALSPAQYEEFFAAHTQNGDEVVHISISSKISSMCEHSIMAAATMKGVYVVDGLSLSTGTALLGFYAKDLRERGLSAAEIAAEVERARPRVQTSFVVNSLEFLHKGGRCSGTARFASMVLRIKPTILMTDGAMSVGKKYIGSNLHNAVLKYVDDTFERMPNPDLKRIFITHSPIPDGLVESVKERIAARYQFETVYVTDAQCTITSHCGKGTLGILYMVKDAE